MIRSTLLALLPLLFVQLNAQDKIRTPAEIMSIMEKSPKSYNIGQLKDEVKAPDYSAKLVYPGYVKKTNDDGSTSVVFYEATEKAQALYDKAEAFFSADKKDSALWYYQKSYAADNNFLQPLVYAGQVHGLRHQYDSAIAYYKKVLARNPIDYMTHWFLADMLEEDNKPGALTEILTAHVLNRNNPRLLVSLKLILKSADLQWNDWMFVPQYKLSGKGKDIDLQYKSPWLGYAIAKAVQQYDDPPKEGATRNLKTDILDREKECLIGLLTQLEGEDTKESEKKKFKFFTEAVEAKMTDAFILYEILLPIAPDVARQLPQSNIDEIVKYLKQVKFAK
jgi:tetratricopeptide (TPR) repeat protein